MGPSAPSLYSVGHLVPADSNINHWQAAFSPEHTQQAVCAVCACGAPGAGERVGGGEGAGWSLALSHTGCRCSLRVAPLGPKVGPKGDEILCTW